MSMHDIKITVLMPCYNAAGYISEAIKSVLGQTFRDFELLIINDGSNDNTAEIIKSFYDERIVFIEQEQQGVAAALNNGLKHARAAYIARFDADDICFTDRLEKQYNFMLSNPEYIIVGSGADYIDDSGNYIFTHFPPVKTNEEIQKLPYYICPFIHASVMYKKDPIANVGYNINAHSFEDHLLWLKLKKQGGMYNMPEPLLSVRLNPGSLTMDERKRSRDFHLIKNKALKEENICNEDGKRLLSIINQQNNSVKKESAYYSLLAKKFLWNNYNPSKARLNMKKAISLNAFDLKDYLLLFISYLPKNVINNLYSIFISPR
jgi:glycosyltransferase involved in cell wall biosynthesis